MEGSQYSSEVENIKVVTQKAFE